jgi:hypothetical protein
MINALRLPLTFDPQALRLDLERILPDQWIPHFNTGDYSGQWSGVALRGPANITHPVQALFANPGTTDWADTELQGRCPYFAEVLARFRCPLQSVRLLRLAPGSIIREHTDHSLSFEDGEVRLHVPIQTNSGVEFYLSGARLDLREGETWYLNVNLPHRVANYGPDDRVHMILDCTVDDWLRTNFEEAVSLDRV